MHENPQVPGDDLARAKSMAPEHHALSPHRETFLIRNSNGAIFDASASLSSLRRLQDASKFHKARFGLRLYKR